MLATPNLPSLMRVNFDIKTGGPPMGIQATSIRPMPAEESWMTTKRHLNDLQPPRRQMGRALKKKRECPQKTVETLRGRCRHYRRAQTYLAFEARHDRPRPLEPVAKSPSRCEAASCWQTTWGSGFLASGQCKHVSSRFRPIPEIACLTDSPYRTACGHYHVGSADDEIPQLRRRHESHRPLPPLH